MDLWIASNNEGKISEYRRLLEAKGINIYSQRELNYYSSPEENGKTFLENARIKVNTLKAVKNNSWILGEDSGLEVFGLNNLPGIYSARYAGDKASDIENYTKILKMLKLRSFDKREAQFKAVLVIYNPNNKEEKVFEGILKGKISYEPRGKSGFGYDPIFIPENEEKTLAELGIVYKNKNSHRAIAMGKCQNYLNEIT